MAAKWEVAYLVWQLKTALPVIPDDWEPFAVSSTDSVHVKHIWIRKNK